MKLFICMFFLMGIISFRSEASVIQWQDCSDIEFNDWFKEPALPILQCGYINVPLKYTNDKNINELSSSNEVRLALTKLPAKGVSKGSLVVISGGPGISGIDSPLDTEGAAKEIHESWDIVAYDPRGVGRSKPIINCTIEEEPLALENYSQDLLNSCIRNTGIDILKHIGTDEAVSDIERIRQAIGNTKLTALAYSYGTQVALLYAERFPNNIQAMVLDGVVDIEEASNTFIMRINQERGYQASFERFAAWCAKENECPLSADKVVATQQYTRLLNELYYTPLSGLDGVQVSAQELITLTYSLLLWKSNWPDLATVVKQISKGEIDEKLNNILIQQNIFSPHDFDSTSDNHQETSDNSTDALLAITCADFSSPELSRSDILDYRRKIREAFPAINFLPEQTDALDLCDLWPWKSNVFTRRSINTVDLPQLFFVAQRHDPTTPWLNARNMATQFKGALITLEGDGHTLALSGISSCVDKAVVDYLNAPQKKQNDKSCYN
ncbi:alpha/beta fold hydrolase [Providencia sp. SP181]|uniref:alpha/beta fold hydrolase n=1 Tax=Providencia sp. SP181 TaxID=3136277 RepID=UPI003D2A2A51